MDQLFDILSKLCDIPDTNPGALYGLKCDAQHTKSDAKDAKNAKRDGKIRSYDAVSRLYSGAVEKFGNHLKTKGLYPENRLIEGFDREQHFQQVALISRESADYFIPDIAFSETQVTDIQFPLGTSEDLKRKQDEEDQTEGIVYHLPVGSYCVSQRVFYATLGPVYVSYIMYLLLTLNYVY